MSHFPNREIAIYNLGVGGHNANRALRTTSEALDRYQINRAFIMLGMNDLRVRPTPEASKPIFTEALAKLIAQVRKHGVEEITLLSPTPYDALVPSERKALVGYNDALAGAADYLRLLAEEQNCEYLDIHTPLTRLNAAYQEQFPHRSLIGKDRVHPGTDTNNLIARMILQAQGISAYQQQIRIDWKGSEATVREGSARVVSVSDEALVLEVPIELPLSQPKTDYRSIQEHPSFPKIDTVTALSVYNARLGSLFKMDIKNGSEVQSIDYENGTKIVLEQTAPVILQTNHVWDAYGAKIQIDHDFQTLAFLKGYAAIKGARFESITSTEDGGEAGAFESDAAFQRYWSRYIGFKDKLDTMPAAAEESVRNARSLSNPCLLQIHISR